MTVLFRPFTGDADLPRIADLLYAMPLPGRHLVDFPWRLSSPALQSAPNVGLWDDASGLLAGIAIWQACWATLDFSIRPGPALSEVETAIFTWAARRFRALDLERGRPLPYWVEACEDDEARLALLARHGYALDDDYAYVVLRCPLAPSFAQPALPPGFAIRPLTGPEEAPAYVAVHRRAFASTSMTEEWRARTLRLPWYRHDLDLVAVTPDGRLAGFCVGWLDTRRRLAQIEPLGIDPEFQRQGLGRALLLAMIQRFKSLGAEHALVETESTRSAARFTYEAVGFHPIHQVRRKGQWFSPQPKRLLSGSKPASLR
jgi:ribosomal protein S18 acetylase RimI-like enzyme